MGEDRTRHHPSNVAGPRVLKGNADTVDPGQNINFLTFEVWLSASAFYPSPPTLLSPPPHLSASPPLVLVVGVTEGPAAMLPLSR